MLYDQMKTAVLREDADVPAVYNPSLVALLGPLRISAEGLQSLSGEDQWQVGAPVPLHPQELLPGSDLSEPSGLFELFETLFDGRRRADPSWPPI